MSVSPEIAILTHIPPPISQDDDAEDSEVLKDDHNLRMNADADADADVNPKVRDNAAEVQNDRAATRVITNKFSPCPLRHKGYYCHVETKRSFGCGFGLRSYCWRSCDADSEKNCKAKYKWCAVDVGTCTYDKNCEVGVHVPCWY